MVGLLLDTLIVIGVVGICSAIAWIDVEQRLEKRKKRKQAMKECLPIWKDIEQEFKEKIPNIAVGYRGILLDQYESKS